MADKGKPKTPEETRAERIANLQDPEGRAAIEHVLDERKAKLIELRKQQNQTYDKHVAQLLKQKETAHNGPYPAPPGLKDAPALSKDKMNWLENEAKGDVIRRYETQWKAAAMPYDQKADRILDAAERRQAREQGHILHKGNGPTLEH